MERRAVKEANLVFLATILLSLLWGYLPGISEISDIFILQMLAQFFLVLPALLYLAIERKSFVRTLGIKKLKVGDWVLIVILALLFNPITTFLNDISMLFAVNTTGEFMAELMADRPLIVSVFVIALTPAFCEEVVYRGVLYQSYRKVDVRKAILLSAFLFGIMHMNFNQFFYACILGILFAVVNEAAGSMLPSMVIHFIINASSTVGLYQAIHTLRDLRADYVAAELANDTARMAEIQAYVGDIPIASENWLEGYMNMEPYTLSEIMRYDLVPAVICLVLSVLVIRLLAKTHGREEHLKKLFTGKRTRAFAEEAEQKVTALPQKKQHLCSAALVIAVLLCVAYMILYEWLIRNVL